MPAASAKVGRKSVKSTKLPFTVPGTIFDGQVIIIGILCAGNIRLALATNKIFVIEFRHDFAWCSVVTCKYDDRIIVQVPYFLTNRSTDRFFLSMYLIMEGKNVASEFESLGSQLAKCRSIIRVGPKGLCASVIGK